MNQLNYEKPEMGAIATDSLILKSSLIGCGGLLLIGLLVFTVARFQIISKANSPEQVTSGNTRRELTTPTQTSEQSPIVVKKPQKPIVVEEESEAWFCLKNNGGSNCLTRDRFAPNYRVIAPPKPQRSYEDYLVRYGVRSDGNCGRYLNGQPNCY